MGKVDTIGQFEQLVMTAVLVLRDDAYGVTIHKKVEQLAERTIALGAVYTTLDRLEDKELARSWMSDPTPERGGRAKRYYALEPRGERALQDAARAAGRICDAAEEFWGMELWNPGRRKWKPARLK